MMDITWCSDRIDSGTVGSACGTFGEWEDTNSSGKHTRKPANNSRRVNKGIVTRSSDIQSQTRELESDSRVKKRRVEIANWQHVPPCPNPVVEELLWYNRVVS